MVGDHRHQHRQREIGVVRAALFAAFAIARIDRLAGTHRGHHATLARNDPEEDVRAHGGREHRAHEQEGRAPREQMAGEPGGEHDEDEDQRADDEVAARALAEGAADQVVNEPERGEEAERAHHRTGGRPGMHARVDEKHGRAEQVEHREQRKAGQPGGIAFPHRPMQMVGQMGRRDRVFLRVVEAAAVHGPEFAGHTFFTQGRIDGRAQGIVEPDEIEGRSDPGDAGDQMRPAQQQIDPVEQVGIHDGI